MPATLRITCVHGLGEHRQSGWEREWCDAITETVGSGGMVDFVTYDPISQRTETSFSETPRAFFKLASSGIGLTRRGRGLDEITDRMRWAAEYVIAWVEDFQAETRQLAPGKLSRYEPHLVPAYSLGSLRGRCRFQPLRCAPRVTHSLCVKAGGL